MNRRVLPASLIAVVVTTLLSVAAPIGATSKSVFAQSDCQTFKETGQSVCDRFLTYWTEHGGLAQQGYPISAEMQEKSDTNGKTYVVQYFERAVFELHPENSAPYDVLLSLLGTFLYAQKYPGGAPNQQPNTTSDSMLFKETGKRLGGKFLQYWNTHGSLAQQGYPISEEFTEKSDLNGKTYTVQYFERAVFEMHPENQPPYDVLLSQLGTFRLRQHAAQSGGTIKIGIDLPVSGGDAIAGIPTANGMKLAIDQANAKGGVTQADGKTYKLEAYLLDDVPPGGGAHDPAQSSQNANLFIADPDVLVVLGPFNSANAKAMMPKLNNAGLCQVSPSNTNETLTKPEYGATQDYRPTGKVTYFRVSGTNDLEAIGAADWMFTKLALHKAYVLDDAETWGTFTAGIFEKRFAEIGGTVVGHDSVPSEVGDFTDIFAKIKATNPDVLYYRGLSSTNIPAARKQMAPKGLDVPMMGTDGIVDNLFLDEAGEAAEGTYGTVVVANAKFIDTAQQFLKDYSAAYGEDAGDYSSFGYDAAGVAIDALKRGGQRDRGAVCDALRNTRNYPGILGVTGFDENGDTTNKIVSFYQVKQGEWKYIDQLRIK